MRKLLLLIVFLVAVKSETFFLKPIRSVLQSTRPCKGNNDIVVKFEVGVQPEDNNRYYVSVNKRFSTDCNIKIVFDSRVTITFVNMDENEFSRKTLSTDDTFSIQFLQPQRGLSFIVKGAESGVEPYLRSFSVNGVEYCNNPRLGFLDYYAAKPKSQVCGRQTARPRPLRAIDLRENPGNYSGPTRPSYWPWHVAILRLTHKSINHYQYICGGTIISKSFILTAAHCVTDGMSIEPRPSAEIKVLLVRDSLKYHSPSEEKEVLEIKIHKEYRGNPSYKNDIALLKLKTVLQFNGFVQPACLWQGNNTMTSTDEILGTIVGWGYDDSDTISETLQQATIPTVPDRVCLLKNPDLYGTLLNENNFCAGNPNGPAPCQGDSGGALQVFVPDEIQKDPYEIIGAWYVKGILSTRGGGQDCEQDEYTIVTNVEKFRDWIDQYVKS